MKICGIIVEYNPLHNGHLWQIQTVRQQLQPDVLVVVMSGNFVQRGDFAIIDKWQRAQMALEAGVDLVVELPFYGAVQPANIFALEALTILQQLQVDTLVFGSEYPKLDYYQLARQIEPITAQATNFVDFHNTYATQFNQAIEQQMGIKVSQPNQLLGLAYAQASLKLNYPLQLTALRRQGQVQHDEVAFQGKYASASAIRQALWQQQPFASAVPQFVAAQLFSLPLIGWHKFFPYLKYRLLTASLAELEHIYQMNEGLEYKFQQEIKDAVNLTDFLRRVKSKRYTYARLRRLCLYTLLDITASQMQQMRQQRYLHVLGFTHRGQDHLHQIKKSLTLPLITKVTQKLGNRNGIMARSVQAYRILGLINISEQNFGRQPLRRK
ncbi:nucleotidyltransferase [Bombilactobacillus bombi]|uniref:nucleotidyltransferase n=1 Tax=Bombilactobacillus bombi TaxID=1303590 RepID=UPI0015E5F98B|nr:nucleotidyltransferase [Bombilactobacillus bombi]MBA1434631.1 nucleotidyltransferase [Bombilactobacillus bombi]